jgi:hypothetical protein
MELAPENYIVERMNVDEKAVTHAIAYGKRMQNSPGRQKTHHSNKHSQNRLSTDTTACGNKRKARAKDNKKLIG